MKDMFRQPSKAVSGKCNLCMKDSKRLKSHISYHLEEMALFALPRLDEAAASGLAFIFQINEMRATATVQRPSRKLPDGTWMPPRRYGKSFISEQGPLFIYAEGQARNMDEDDLMRLSRGKGLAAFKWYGDLSMYYNYRDERFHAIMYDATRFQVGDGTHENDPDNDEGYVAPEQRETGDWAELGFEHPARDPYDRSHSSYSSQICVQGSQDRLRIVRSGQRWVPELLPHGYRDVQEYTPDPRDPRTNRYGGMFGDIRLLLALIAFSTPEATVAALSPLIPQCVRSGPWRSHGLKPNRNSKPLRQTPKLHILTWPLEHHHRRGVVVHVWHVETPNEMIREFGEGKLHKIYE